MLNKEQKITDNTSLINGKVDNVTIDIDFLHPYEINFILVKFCGPMPAAMVIYKSVSCKFKFMFNSYNGKLLLDSQCFHGHA